MKKLFYALLTIVLIHCWSLGAVAQSSNVTTSRAVQNLASPIENSFHDIKDLNKLKQAPQIPDIPEAVHNAANQPWSSELVMTLSIAVLCFTLITIVFCISILWKKDFVALELLRVVGIVSIIGLSAILLITGFSNDQLTPIIGLFGAISGYLLGKESKQINA